MYMHMARQAANQLLTENPAVAQSLLLIQVLFDMVRKEDMPSFQERQGMLANSSESIGLSVLCVS